MKPLFRWVGGKRRMVDKLKEHMPSSYNSYIEPFAGAAALFFELEPLGKAILNDANRDLIAAYRTIQTDPAGIHSQLRKCVNSKADYDAIRASRPTNIFWMAVRFLYLNRLAVNGLWRENLRGEMNTPYDHRRSGVDMDMATEILEASRVLNLGMRCEFTRTHIIDGHYLNVTSKACAGDLVYMDPPYMPYTANGHVDYTAKGFTMADHIELREEFGRLDKMGVHVILTNSDVPEVHEMYKGYVIERVETKASVARTSGQGSYGELIISNRRVA